MIKAPIVTARCNVTMAGGASVHKSTGDSQGVAGISCYRGRENYMSYPLR